MIHDALDGLAGEGLDSNDDGTLSVNVGTGIQIVTDAVTSKDSEIDHDELANYDGDQHIDWTGATENFLTTGSITGGSAVIGAGANYLQVEADGTIEFNGTATVWDDLRIAGSSIRIGPSFPPSFEQYKDDGGGSVGVYLNYFEDVIEAQEQNVFFVAQMPHKWKLASTIYPHVHWTPNAAGGAGEEVRWGLEYTWVDYGETGGNTTIINASAHGPSENLISGRHYITPFASIAGTGHTLSSMLVCRLYRNSSHADDDFTGKAGFLEFDFHYEIDTIGSRQEYVK